MCVHNADSKNTYQLSRVKKREKEIYKFFGEDEEPNSYHFRLYQDEVAKLNLHCTNNIFLHFELDLEDETSGFFGGQHSTTVSMMQRFDRRVCSQPLADGK